MELSELKVIISEEIGKGEILSVLYVFRDVLTDSSETYNDFVRERSRYSMLEKDYIRGNMPYDRYLIERSKIVESLTELQSQIIDEDLVENWIQLPIIQSYLDTEEEEVGIKNIEVSKNISDIILTQNAPDEKITKELDKEAFVLLETLLLKTQDAIEVESYEEAEKFCLEAKEIDKKNPQIYEYLALIQFKRKPANEILKGAIYGNDIKKTLKHIFQYVRRFHQFKNKYRSDAISIAEGNIKTIGIILSEHVKKEYDKISDDKRDYIWKCLDFYREIYELMYKPISFLDTAILELSGAGKVLWLKVEKDKIKNRYGRNYDALALRKDFVGKLLTSYLEKDLEEEEAIQKSRKRLANNFYYKIFRNYNRIHQVKDPKTGKGSWTDLSRREIIQYLNASKVGYLLFKDSEHLDEDLKLRFLIGPFNELKGEGKPFLKWISLSNNGQLTTFFMATRQRYDALSELKYFMTEMGGDFGELKVELKNTLFKKQLKETQRIYAQVEKEMYSTMPNVDKARANLIKYFNKQIVVAKQGIGKVENHLELPLKELTGNGFFTDWIEINSEHQLANTTTSNELNLDAVEILQKLLYAKEDFSVIFNSINNTFFDEFFKVNYLLFQELNTGQVLLSEEVALQIIQCLKNFELAFLATSNLSYLKSIYDEISSSSWVFKNLGKYQNQPICGLLGFNAVKYLNRIVTVIQSIKNKAK